MKFKVGQLVIPKKETLDRFPPLVNATYKVVEASDEFIYVKRGRTINGGFFHSRFLPVLSEKSLDDFL